MATKGVSTRAAKKVVKKVVKKVAKKAKQKPRKAGSVTGGLGGDVRSKKQGEKEKGEKGEKKGEKGDKKGEKGAKKGAQVGQREQGGAGGDQLGGEHEKPTVELTYELCGIAETVLHLVAPPPLALTGFT
jgi:hypothetical protein